jgi:hypothetical protein
MLQLPLLLPPLPRSLLLQLGLSQALRIECLNQSFLTVVIACVALAYWLPTRQNQMDPGKNFKKKEKDNFNHANTQTSASRHRHPECLMHTPSMVGE